MQKGYLLFQLGVCIYMEYPVGSLPKGDKLICDIHTEGTIWGNMHTTCSTFPKKAMGAHG